MGSVSGFVAQAFATYLIIGPWKRSGVASTSGTEPFRPETWLPTAFDTRLSPIAIGLAVAVLVGVGLVMRGTRFGLRLRAVGSNPASARLLGVPADATTMRAFLVGGGLAGLAGAMIVTGVQHKLVPAIAGGRGFLAVLVVLLAGVRVRWVGPIALFLRRHLGRLIAAAASARPRFIARSGHSRSARPVRRPVRRLVCPATKDREAKLMRTPG